MKQNNLSTKVESLIAAIQSADVIEISPTTPAEKLKLWTTVRNVEEKEYYLSLTEELSGEDEGLSIETVILYETLDSATIEDNQIATQDEDGNPIIIAIFAKTPITIDIN